MHQYLHSAHPSKLNTLAYLCEIHNFVRRDELEQAWRIFDPLLHHLEQVEQRVPERYAFGSRGPRRADTLINSMGFKRYTVTGVPGFAEDDRD